jgi:predicted permease
MTKRPGLIAAVLFTIASAVPLVVISNFNQTKSSENYAIIASFCIYFLLMHFVAAYGAKALTRRLESKKTQSLLGVVSPNKNPDQGVLFDEDDVLSK